MNKFPLRSLNRLFRVGGLLRQLEANQRHNGAGRVGQVVHGVSSDGNGAGQGADNDFSEEKEDCSQSQDLKQNLTIVSDAANFAGNMPTTALIGRRLLILAARGMMCYI